MPLSLEEVEHIARLARLCLDEGEKERYRAQLSAILDYFAQLQQVDTQSIPPTSSVGPRSSAPDAKNVLREDLPRPGLSTGQLMLNAPDVMGEQFRVPPVLE